MSAAAVSGHLWQARYFSCVLSPAHLDVALRYVERNPVRALMTETADTYPWSSAAAHSASEPPDDPLLDFSIWLNYGGAAPWRTMLADPDPAPLVHMLRRCTFGERPFGDEQFLQSIEAQTGRSWKRYTFDAELRNGTLAFSLESLRQKVAAAQVGTTEPTPSETRTHDR
jgi:putative transposase